LESKYKVVLKMLKSDLKKMGIRGWRKIGRDTEAWKLILKETKVLHGP